VTNPTTISAQWALHGKRLDRTGYRILACSDGELGQRNFEDAISRFSPGTPGELPQVSVSYIPSATVAGVSYLAMAVHKFADEIADDDGQQLKYDDDGRRIVITSYFCLPFPSLEGQAFTHRAVAYQALYKKLDSIRLPQEDGPPLTLTLATDAIPTPVIDDLAMQAAALLLTFRPVCVLGAHDTTAAERLAFLDAVMSLLPYGLRAATTAATWTRATHRDHRFRLFFSDVARAADPPDRILYWGQPEETGITAADDWAYEYLTWLRDKAGQPVAKLAGLIDPMRFKREEILPFLDEIGIVASDPGLNYSATGHDYLHEPHVPRPTPGQGQGYGEQILLTCARHLREDDQGKIKSDISRLKNMADSTVDDDKRIRYRRILKETGLLKQAETLGGDAGKLYEPLLRLAFTVPLSYKGYCQLEDCLENPAPPRPLLRAIDSAGLSDQVVTAIIYWRLQALDGRTTLDKWYASGQVSASQLIQLLAASGLRPHHARVICDVTLDYLDKMGAHTKPTEIRAALQRQSFLGHALQANKVGPEKYQIDALSQFLRSAYPNRLDRSAILQILTSTHHPPTPPLVAAVLLRASGQPGTRPAGTPADLVAEAYAYGSLTLADFDPDTHRRLEPLLPLLPLLPAENLDWS
jgi:hypothetical protein